MVDIKDDFVSLLEKMPDTELEIMYFQWKARANKNEVSKAIFEAIEAEKEKRKSPYQSR